GSGQPQHGRLRPLGRRPRYRCRHRLRGVHQRRRPPARGPRPAADHRVHRLRPLRGARHHRSGPRVRHL
ncbi:MAG: ATP synthase F0 sector subunit c, partial [uncultured Actinomycetospora sp.]